MDGDDDILIIKFSVGSVDIRYENKIKCKMMMLYWKNFMLLFNTDVIILLN